MGILLENRVDRYHPNMILIFTGTMERFDVILLIRSDMKKSRPVNVRASIRFSASFSCQQGYQFDMIRLREQVDRLHTFKLVAVRNKFFYIRRVRERIARNVDDPVRFQPPDAPHHFAARP